MHNIGGCGFVTDDNYFKNNDCGRKCQRFVAGLRKGTDSAVKFLRKLLAKGNDLLKIIILCSSKQSCFWL